MTAVDRAMNQWWEACEEYDVPTDAHSQLRQVVRRTLSEQAVTAIAFDDDLPIIIAIDEDRLICIRLRDPATSGAGTQIEVDSLALDLPRRVGVSFGHRELAGRSLLVRGWRIGEPGLTEFRLETRPPLSSLRDSNAGRELIEEVVCRLGWSLPKS